MVSESAAIEHEKHLHRAKERALLLLAMLLSHWPRGRRDAAGMT